MSDEFTAISVSWGDAFLYKRGSTTILVDGGEDDDRIINHLKGTVDRIDILVVTHNDSDHTSGIVGLLEARPHIVRELWLPAHWTFEVDSLLVSPCTYFREKARQYGELAGDVEALRIFENETIDEPAPEPEAQEPAPEDEPGRPRIDGRHLTAVSPAFPKGLRSVIWMNAVNLDRRIKDCPTYLDRFSPADPVAARLYKRAVPKMTNIYRLLVLALKKRIPVRWFDVRAFQSSRKANGGVRGTLVPLNSQECHTLRPLNPNTPAKRVVQLTTENRTALVFYAPESAEHPGVLFTSDAGLAVQQKELLSHGAPKESMVVTVPHHGSKDSANVSVYGKVETWHVNPGKLIWVRSDGRDSSRPTPAYIGVKGSRFCTLCKVGSGQTVKLSSSGMTWAPVGVNRCQC